MNRDQRFLIAVALGIIGLFVVVIGAWQFSRSLTPPEPSYGWEATTPFLSPGLSVVCIVLGVATCSVGGVIALGGKSQGKH